MPTLLGGGADCHRTGCTWAKRDYQDTEPTWAKRPLAPVEEGQEAQGPRAPAWAPSEQSRPDMAATILASLGLRRPTGRAPEPGAGPNDTRLHCPYAFLGQASAWPRS